jgi:chemotaxis protein MotB
VEREGDFIVLRFDNVLLFDTGKAEIKAGSILDLSLLGEKLKEYIDQNYVLDCEGHTDNVPIKTAQFPSNWELSAARAIAVAKFYVEEMDFDPQKVSARGFGEYNPIADNATAEGRSMNRRVEIKLSKSN